MPEMWEGVGLIYICYKSGARLTIDRRRGTIRPGSSFSLARRCWQNTSFELEDVLHFAYLALYFLGLCSV